MMYDNCVLAQLLAAEKVKDALREAEQARLARLANGPKKVRRWRWWLRESKPKPLPRPRIQVEDAQAAGH